MTLPKALTLFRYAAGQGVVTIVGVSAGLLAVWILPREEFGIYVIAVAIQNLVVVGSDMGLAQGVNTIGARIVDAPLRQGSVIRAALLLRGWFFLAVTLVAFCVGSLMLPDQGIAHVRGIGLFGFVVVTGWVQSGMNIKRSILHVHHDATSLFRVGLAESGGRLISIAICYAYPKVELLLFLNLAAIVVSGLIMDRSAGAYFSRNVDEGHYKEELRHFVLPLIPSSIYMIVQGGLAVFLLGIYGGSGSVAEVGALSRMGHVIGFMTLLNPFFVQPMFARVVRRDQFVRTLARLMLLVFAASGVLVGSAYLAPSWWLLLLGKQYATLESLVVLAIVGPVVYLWGNIAYTIVIARGATRWQYWTVLMGLSAQALFLAAHGVATTADGIMLNLLTCVTYFLVQAALLAHILRTWPADAHFEKP